MIPQNPIRGVITALYRAHSDGGAAQGVELLDRHVCTVHCAVIVLPEVEGHHPVDDAARQVLQAAGIRPFTGVTIPAARGRPGYVAIWMGLGGYGSAGERPSTRECRR